MPSSFLVAKRLWLVMSAVAWCDYTIDSLPWHPLGTRRSATLSELRVHHTRYYCIQTLSTRSLAHPLKDSMESNKAWLFSRVLYGTLNESPAASLSCLRGHYSNMAPGTLKRVIVSLATHCWLVERRKYSLSFCVQQQQIISSSLKLYFINTEKRVVCAKNTWKSSTEAKKEIAKGEFLCQKL